VVRLSLENPKVFEKAALINTQVLYLRSSRNQDFSGSSPSASSIAFDGSTHFLSSSSHILSKLASFVDFETQQRRPSLNSAFRKPSGGLGGRTLPVLRAKEASRSRITFLFLSEDRLSRIARSSFSALTIFRVSSSGFFSYRNMAKCEKWWVTPAGWVEHE